MRMARRIERHGCEQGYRNRQTSAAARVMAQCQPNEVWVSRVVTDLLDGAV
jgi:hypothetical protein